MNDNRPSAEANLSLALLHLSAAHRKDPKLVGNMNFYSAMEQVNNQRRRCQGKPAISFQEMAEDALNIDEAMSCMVENFEALVNESASWDEDMNVNIVSKKVKHLSSDAPDQN